ncbi:MAG: biotin--[acetyl-CoA-carboxylase] ligase, partial [Candidatus Eisenbacteria bacterium]|nr:biotin--[acetyl-CoA-carboxylase] ligase [Candidatus Eisenbacteria bacterium]
PPRSTPFGTRRQRQMCIRDSLASDPAPGTLVVARSQAAGRGRGGRVWSSPADRGLWCTLIHRSARPPREWPALTAIAAMAVAGALRGLGEDPALKWPNDVLLGGRKVAGILADVESGAALIGIGVDLMQDKEDFEPALRSVATSLAMERRRRGASPVGVEEFLRLFLPSLGDRLDRFEQAGPGETLRDAWEACCQRGREVALELPDGTRVSGRATGLGPAGEIVLDGPGGAHAYASGTVVGGVVGEREE